MLFTFFITIYIIVVPSKETFIFIFSSLRSEAKIEYWNQQFFTNYSALSQKTGFSYYMTLIVESFVFGHMAATWVDEAEWLMMVYSIIIYHK